MYEDVQAVEVIFYVVVVPLIWDDDPVNLDADAVKVALDALVVPLCLLFLHDVVIELVSQDNDIDADLLYIC